MFKALTSVLAIVALSATDSLQAQIFDSSGPDAPLVLFDADDYDANTGDWPNIGTGGATNNAFAPAGDYAFLNDPPYHVNTHPDPLEPDLGPPTKTANAFAGTHDGVTFDIQFVTEPSPEGPQTFPIGQGLIFEIDGLPKSTDREVTFFAVFNKQFNSKSGLIGYGKAETECCLDEDDNLTLWTTNEQGPFPGTIEIGSDSGKAASQISYFAGTTTIASATVQSDDAVRFSVREAGGALQTTGPMPANSDFDNTLANLGHIGFYFDFRPRPMDGDIAMLAIIPGAISDTKRDTIVNDLYERYVNGGNEPLIMQTGIPGDHNGDGQVDAADYVVWRKNDIGNQQGYNDWVANFGAGAGSASSSASSVTGVPEPATMLLVLSVVISLLVTNARRRRGNLAGAASCDQSLTESSDQTGRICDGSSEPRLTAGPWHFSHHTVLRESLMTKQTSAIVAMCFAAVFVLVSVADAGWVENWNSYLDEQVVSGDWVVTSAVGPKTDDRLALLPAPPMALNGNRDGENNHVTTTTFRAVDPGDSSMTFSWFRRKGNTTIPFLFEIGMFTDTDLSSARVTLNGDMQDPLFDQPNEFFESSPGGGTFATTIAADDDGWFDGIIQLLPGGTQARVGWRSNTIGGPYTESTLPLPAGFAFNYVGINISGFPGPNGPGNRVENIEVVPEPTSTALIGMSLLGLLAFAPRRRG